MHRYIEGNIGENRALTFAACCGYTGENDANCLKIRLENTDMQGAGRYFVTFEISPGNTVVSNEITNENCRPAFISEGYIYCPLTASLTQSGNLAVQVTAVYTQGEEEREVKSGVARLSFGESLGQAFTVMSEEYSGVFSALDSIEARLDIAEEALLNTDYDLVAAAVCASLVSKRDGSTRLYCPASADEAAGLINHIIESVEPDENITHLVVTPAAEFTRACLYIVRVNSGSCTVSVHSGAELIRLLLSEVSE